jgi:hypothetical protein
MENMTTTKRVECKLSTNKTVRVSLYGWSQTDEQRATHGDLGPSEVEEAWSHHARLCEEGVL